MKDQDYRDTPTSSTVPKRQAVQVHQPFPASGDNFDTLATVPSGMDASEFMEALAFYSDANAMLERHKSENS